MFLLENCTDGDVRVVGGPSPRVGRVEVCVKNIWGTICNTTWNFMSAAIICKQLGYSSYGNMKIVNSSHLCQNVYVVFRCYSY